MPTTRKQKKPRKSTGAEMLSDIENLDIILGGNHLDRQGSEFSDSIRRPDSPNFNAPDKVEKHSYPNSMENTLSHSDIYGHNSAVTHSSAEFNRLSGELNLRISREMDEVINSVCVHIQRAINDAISNQFLPQIQNAVRAGSGSLTQEGWNIATGRPERDAEDNSNQKIRSSSRSEPFRNCLHDEVRHR